MCSPKTWSFEPDATSNQLRTPHPENQSQDQLQTAGQTYPETISQDQFFIPGQLHPETTSQDQLLIPGQPKPDNGRQDQPTTGLYQPETRNLDQTITSCPQPDNRRHCYKKPQPQPDNRRNCCLKPLPGSKKPQPQPNQPSNHNTTIHKTSTHKKLINCALLLVSFLLLLSTWHSMAEDEAPNLEATRLQLNQIIDEVHEIRTELMTQEDETPYELLDAGELEDLEADLGALLNRGQAFRTKLLAEEVDEEAKTDDNKHWKALQKTVKTSKITCRRLMASREVAGKIQVADRILTQLKARRLEFPSKDYSLPTKRVADAVVGIMEALAESTLPAEHKLRTMAMELEISLEDMEIVELLLTPDIKPIVKMEPPKMQPIAPPTFSGQQKDWQAFWAAFRDINDCPKYSDTTKLCYLKQAQKDTSLHQQLCENVAHGDSYAEVVEGLLDQYDRPREDHRIYVENLTKMEPVKATRSSIMACATTLQSSVNGLNRLGQVDMQSIFTTLIEPLLPEKLKVQWEEATVENKKVPKVNNLIAFLRKRAAMPQYADKLPPHELAERKSYRPQPSRQKGSVHVTTNSPVQPSPGMTEPTGSRHRITYPPCRYSCPLCEEAHYAWACSTFKGKTLAERKEHVKTHNLCENCLKPGHTQSDCNSRFTCQTCAGKHNTLIHSGSAPLTTTGAIHHLSIKKPKAKLLMTCKVMITGPTGKTMPVRALLDSGADTCSITSKVAKHLSLKQLKETVAISPFGNNHQMICQTTSFQLSSLLKADWTHQVMAVIVDQITGDQPREDASAVRSLTKVKDLILADPLFDSPGRIDVLIGADVLPYVMITPEPPSSIMTRDTVFGHAIMGTYSPSATTNKASMQLAVQSTPEDDLTHLRQDLARFWEMDNLLKPSCPYNKTELRALTEYADTHHYNQSKKMYQVILPRRMERRPLGESKTQALQRYFQNTKSLTRKGGLQKFREVLQEYVDLRHARLCTAEELQMPASKCYYLPMFGIVKNSSTTTKLRIVFDASAVTTSGWSLNDTLEAGPMLHPKLAEILIKFRKYRVALTGDITKMYRQLLLTPEDQQFHRFFHQPDPDEPPQVHCMSRVTFGVTCSPFLAVRTLQQTAEDFGKDCPAAQKHINESFYVDDLLGGADSIEGTKTLYRQLADILLKGGFTLRKYRSSSQEVLDIIPADMKEDLPTKEMVDSHSETYPKALGVIWNSTSDTMSVDVNHLGGDVRSKRDILSDTFKTFDVMGWIAPAILPMKIFNTGAMEK